MTSRSSNTYANLLCVSRSWWTRKEKGSGRIGFRGRCDRQPTSAGLLGAQRDRLDATTDTANRARSKGSDSTHSARWAAISLGATSDTPSRAGGALLAAAATGVGALALS